MMSGLPAGADRVDRARDRGARRRAAAGCVQTRVVEERRRVVERLGLRVLRQRQRDRAGLGRGGQHAHRFGQRRQQLLGAGDAIPVPRHRPEAVVDRDVLRLAATSSCCSTGRRHAVGEDVAGQQQHRQPVDRRAGGAGHHVGGAGADRRGARQRPQPVRHLGERRRGVHHRLFVAALVVAKPVRSSDRAPGRCRRRCHGRRCRTRRRRRAAAARRAR